MSCRTQYYDRGNTLSLAPDTDGLQWLLLFHRQRGMAELIPLECYKESGSEPASTKGKKAIHFRFVPVNDGSCV